MVIVDLLGWMVFFLLVVGATWAGWRVWGDVRQEPARTHERIPDGQSERDDVTTP